MTGSREKAVIVRCPYDATLGCELYRRGAELSMPEILDLVLHFALPSGTYWRYRHVTYLWYRAVRYTLTEDGDVDESSAAVAVQDDSTSYHPKWKHIPTCTENDSMIHF